MMSLEESFSNLLLTMEKENGRLCHKEQHFAMKTMFFLGAAAYKLIQEHSQPGSHPDKEIDAYLNQIHIQQEDPYQPIALPVVGDEIFGRA